MEFINNRKMSEFIHSINLFDLNEILDVAIAQIPKIVYSHRVSIYLLDNEEEEYLISKRHSSKRLQEHLEEKVSISSKHSLIPQIFAKQRPLLIPNVADFIIKNNLSIKLSRRQRYTSGSCMLVPISVRVKNNEKITGVINFSEKADFTPFSKIDLELATQIGQILGTSVHNCYVAEKKLGGQQKQLMKELEEVKQAYKQKEINLDEAKKRQSQMQSEIPVIEGYDMDVVYSPMETIGGDFYDFVPLNEHELGIIVGDVSGHGIEAALVMSMAKHILSIYIKLHRSLVDTLCQANDEICSSLKGEAFVAVFLGILNTKNRTLRFVRAGQAYPLVFNPSRDENPFELQSKGMVLGTIGGDTFRNHLEEKNFKIFENDTILIYSDGITEASDAHGEEFGVDGVSKIIKEMYSETASSVNEELLEKAEKMTNAEKQDDITILTIKASNLPEEVEEEDEAIGVIIPEDFHEQSEAFVIQKDYSFDNDLEISNLEKKLFDLENNFEELQKKNIALERKNKELLEQIELENNDPESLILLLRSQLEVALGLPKDLIQDNKQLNEKIKIQQEELQKLEVELNELTSHIEYVNNERKSTEEESQFMGNIVTYLAEKIKNSVGEIHEDIMQADLKLDRTTYEQVMDGNYLEMYNSFDEKFKKLLEEKNYNKLPSLQKQLFAIINILQQRLDTIFTVFAMNQ